MVVLRALGALIVLAVAVPAAAQAPVQAPVQAWPLTPGASAVDLHRYQADRHRYEMDRLRAQAEQRESFARQLQLETRLNRLEIEAARLPEPIQPPTYRVLRSPEEERALRQSATERRRATAADVGQIDSWLDRPRN